MARYEVRAATLSDAPGMVELASYLDSVNLPNDQAAVEQILRKSDESFSGAIGDARCREYVFALHDLETGKVVGSSLIVGQLGRRDAPYIYFSVRQEERYSNTLDRHFVHDVLSIGYSYNGPTEIGGLIMHPGSRRVGAKLGMLISYVRFLFMAMHREDVQDTILAELLPPLESDGTSHLWEAVGRHFTNMSYREADRLSRRNKEFIRGLFPDGDIYASLLPPEAQAVIGEVGPQTRGVEKILRRIGFRYVDRVDPFDGGPHFAAPTDDITLIQRSAKRTLVPLEVEAPHRILVAKEYDAAPWFRAQALFGECTDSEIALSDTDREGMGLAWGDEIWSLPLR